MTLTPTQAAILAAALQHPQHLVAAPARLAPAPRDAIRKSLLAKGLIEPAAGEAPDEAAAWSVDGAPAHYRLAKAGLRAASGTAGSNASVTAATVATGAPEAPQAAGTQEGAQGRPQASLEPAGAAPSASARQTLREVATAVLAAWDASADRTGAEEAIAALRIALAGKTPRQPRQPGMPRALREGTKQQTVLAMLRRPEGATVAQVAAATGWQPHTVRGFFAGLKKRQGIVVEVQERVRQVGVEGAKGSYTVYRIADAD